MEVGLVFPALQAWKDGAWLWDGLELGGIQKSISPSNDYLSLPKWIHFEWLFIFHDIPLASDSRNDFIRGLGQVQSHCCVQLSCGAETKAPSGAGP